MEFVNFFLCWLFGVFDYFNWRIFGFIDFNINISPQIPGPQNASRGI